MGDFEEKADVLVCRTSMRRVDAAVAPEFRTWLIDRMGEGRRSVVLNVGSVEFVDSAGLSVLVAARRRLAEGGQLRLCCVSPAVRRVLGMTMLDSFFRCYDSESNAIVGD
jgi:anti-sigma B factor antagonist